jgi:hypothetical protein
MRFVKGDSLKEAIEALHGPAHKIPPSPRRGVGARMQSPLICPSDIFSPRGEGAGEGATDNLGERLPLTDHPSPQRGEGARRAGASLGEGNRGTVASPLALHKLLRRFTDVCNAIEYAHSRGVLHGCDRAHAIDYATFLGFFSVTTA